MRTAITVLALFIIACTVASAEQQIPSASMEKLRDVFTGVRDQLWDHNDDFWHHGEFNRCIATMRVITAMDPHDTDAYTDGAWLMSSDLREEDAEAYLREGLANNTDSYDMYLELGNFCYLRKRYDEAIYLFTGAVAFDCPPFVWHLLAHAYEHAGRVGDSLETWFEIQAIEPDNGVPPMQIDRILAGGEPSEVPDSVVKSIEQRKEDRAKGLGD